MENIIGLLQKDVWTTDIENYPDTKIHRNNYPELYNFTYKNYFCEIHRNFMGVLCGYVTIPPNIKCKNFDNIKVHGGITFNDGHKIGFDCGHFTDIVPIDSLLKNNYDLDRNHKVYKDYNFVKSELYRIVDQLIKIE